MYHGFEGVKGERSDCIRVTEQLVERRDGAQVIHIGLQGREREEGAGWATEYHVSG